ncbi:YigZ family protein [Sulfitobacter geojensis]|uniref:YigZ family protein n=1 Tax=Sulfitobacter geojensis TaxID=1342299 RepID=A0AAE2VX90_9RHOB|nr:YigZ family protein [Sulfitobacter geojensis]MBM1689080.1 YigZ family protein [Sulfitobacter geojensis]MBM1693147.1 YigZ family protein [Sulfitobacter geojensis]MBM1705313.1 YigZ family protein [Sulfitobacter geojensis]MBM1709371.1 YigZ family protein [Sulfitobacter geojensis]MBM1713436.1 YigZ family protein [Sulfitobacter geojensis]
MGKLIKLGNILTDRGSKYAVSGAAVLDRSDVDAVLKSLKRDKAYAKATHNTWGVLLPDGVPLKGDDGESGAGMVILRMLEREALQGHVIIVTRWYGGKHLGGDRFRHVQTCVSAYLDAHAANADRDGAKQTG